MSSEAGPSRQTGPSSAVRPVGTASTSSSVATSSTSTPGSGTAARAAAGPGAFSAGGAPRGAAASTGPVSAVVRGKQPAQPMTAQAGSRPGSVQQQAGTGVPRTSTGGQQGATPVNSTTGPTSVGGPAGLVRRQVLNSILVNTRQVRVPRSSTCQNDLSLVP